MKRHFLFTAALCLLLPTMLIAQTPNAQIEALKKQAEEAVQKGQQQKAIDITTAVIQQSPKDGFSHYLRGSAKVELGKKTGAIKLVRSGIADAREAIRLDPSQSATYHLPYLYGMVQLSVLEKKTTYAQVAIKVANSIVARKGVSNFEKANIIYQRGLAHSSIGKPEAAIADYEEVIQLVPNHAGALLTVANIYISIGKTKKAAESFDRASRALPKNAMVYNNKGMFLQRQGKAQDAVNAFTKAIRINPNFTVAYTNRGFALLRSGNAKDAETDLNSSIKLSPRQSLAYGYRAEARLKLGKTVEAIADRQRVIQNNPKNPIAHAELGFAYFFIKQYSKSADSFGISLSLQKKARHFHPWRYTAMLLAGKENQAKLAYATIIKKKTKERDWGDLLLAYVSGYASEADLLAAAKVLKHPVASKQLATKMKAQRTCEAHFFIGIKQLSAGKKEAATKHFQQAIATNARDLSAFRGAEYALK
ncbi:hypothetical protein MNBD_PLANCTO02-3072 [hydrothermal vent metagenome]|uniref:TPR domain protein, component of TonB system n=1 Tax=hydrothermal vent metagenome TaxID=652676 RepID=A0A3B1DX53_9ZZZZ